MCNQDSMFMQNDIVAMAEEIKAQYDALVEEAEEEYSDGPDLFDIVREYTQWSFWSKAKLREWFYHIPESFNMVDEIKDNYGLSDDTPLDTIMTLAAEVWLQDMLLAEVESM